ncbi:hypothetical protein Dimus_009609 [Dionaea muscipula]
MSVLQHSEAMGVINPGDVQIWNNVAFDNGESDEPTMPIIIIQSSPSSCSKSKPSFLYLPEPDSSTKENQNPCSIPSPVPHLDRSASVKRPLHANAAVKNIHFDRPCLVPRRGDEKNIDSEIEEIEKEIERLSSRLESLRLEKAQRNSKSMEKRGRVVASKFMEVKEKSGKVWDGKIEELGTMTSVGLKTLNPPAGLGRRGVSLGPAEIYSETTRLRLLGKQEILVTPSPIQQAQNRRKSCFWKLGEIDEVKAIKQRGKSLSPKSRKCVSKLPAWKSGGGAATTVGMGSKKFVKKEDGGGGIIVPLIQPKNLFKEEGQGEESATKTAKKPLKNGGRVVASRYSINGGGSSAIKDFRKRTLAENDKEEEEVKKCDHKKRISLAGKPTTPHNQAKMMKDDDKKKNTTMPPVSDSKLLELVPKIRTRRQHCINDNGSSPRDSGAAKRVSQLIGKKSYFTLDDDEWEEDPEDAASYPMLKTSCCIDQTPRGELIGRRKSVFDDSSDDDEWKTSIFQALHFA